MSFIRERPLITAVALLLAGVAPQAAVGAGNESSRRASDLGLTVDTRWAGGANGGYFPIRIRLTNTARPRNLVFRFTDSSSDASKNPTVERRVLVDQNATLQFTLSVPLVSANSGGTLRIYEGGRQIEELAQHVNLPDMDYSPSDRPALLVIHPSPAGIDCTKFEEAVQALAGGAGPPGTPGFRGGYLGARANDYEVIAPVMLPESWIDYSTLDVIAIPLSTLNRLPSAARNALLQWTEAGGTLLVTEIGGPPERSTELARLLELDARPATSRTWQPAPREQHRPIPSAIGAAEAAAAAAAAAGVVIGGLPNPAEIKPSEDPNRPVWTVSDDTFRRIDLLAGRVYAFPDNPFPGAAVDWAWWMNAANFKSLTWRERLGNSTRRENADFFNFLIPGVGAVPVVAFLLLISLFAVVIGPVNYFIVLRRKQLYLLVITIPVIALLTSGALFGYSMIADGFSVQSRLRSFTILDQGTKRAVSFNRISLYAGLAPSAGMQFSPETAVFPIWKDDTGFESGAVDWTDSQALTTGWLRSRTRTQFETIVPRVERGRVEFTATGGGPPQAANGLEWPIDTLVVKDESGKVYAGRNLPAGATLQLHVAEKEDFAGLTSLLQEFDLKTPEGASVGSTNVFNPRSTRWMYGNQPAVGMSSSTLERGLDRLRRADPSQSANDQFLPRSYLATFRENPGIELGVERTVPKATVAAMLGFY